MTKNKKLLAIIIGAFSIACAAIIFMLAFFSCHRYPQFHSMGTNIEQLGEHNLQLELFIHRAPGDAKTDYLLYIKSLERQILSDVQLSRASIGVNIFDKNDNALAFLKIPLREFEFTNECNGIPGGNQILAVGRINDKDGIVYNSRAKWTVSILEKIDD